MDQIKIGKFIAELRKEKKLTQEELAVLLGVSNKSVSRWENGKNLPDAALYQPLCHALGISLTELLSGECIAAENMTGRAEESLLSMLECAKQKIRSVNKRFLTALAVCVLLAAGLFVTLDKTVFAPGAWHEGDVSQWQSFFPPKTAYRLALNDENKPVFVDPAKAIREARRDYAEAIRAVRKDNHLLPLPLCRLYYHPYGMFGWQTDTGDELLNAQCRRLSKFVGIYKNSFDSIYVL